MARRDPVLAEVYEGGDMALDKSVLHSRPEDQPVDDFDMMTLTARLKPSAKPVTQDQEEKTIIENTVRSRVSGTARVHRVVHMQHVDWHSLSMHQQCIFVPEDLEALGLHTT